MANNVLYIIEGKDYCAMAVRVMEACAVADRIPGKDALIGIKPNLLGPISAEDGATTHPEVVEGIITYLRSHGFFRIVMLESSWVGDKTTDSLLVTGFGELSRKMDVPFWDLQEDRGIETDCGGMKLKLCERALQVDYLINVPVLKGHCQTKVTCALKNMKGIIPGSEKRRFHRLGLHEPIGHLSLGKHQDFILADHICGDLTCEDGGNPVQTDRLIAGFDPVLMDTFAAAVLGLTPDDVPYICVAAENGVGSADLKGAVVNEINTQNQCEQHSADAAAKTLCLRYADRCTGVLDIAEYADEVDSCSACYAALVPALRRLAEERLIGLSGEKVCIGQGHRGKGGYLGVGNCTAQFTHHVKGCPPSEEEIYQFLKAYYRSSDLKNEQ